jgi:hypothetical protein
LKSSVVVFEVLQDEFAEVRQLGEEERQHKEFTNELRKLESEINLLETEDVVTNVDRNCQCHMLGSFVGIEFMNIAVYRKMDITRARFARMRGWGSGRN